MWIILGLIVILIIVPIAMKVSGSDSTYCVMYYGMTREHTGSKASCESWIENKIKQEKEHLTNEMKKMCLEHNLPQQDISQELKQLEIGLRQNYKIVRLN